jgi:hypothetical protein
VRELVIGKKKLFRCRVVRRADNTKKPSGFGRNAVIAEYDDEPIQFVTRYRGLRAMPPNSASRGLSLMFKPGLEHEHIPQVILPIHSAGQMLSPDLTDRMRIEESLIAQLFFV